WASLENPLDRSWGVGNGLEGQGPECRALPQKPKLKPGKSLPLGVEELGQLPNTEAFGGRGPRKSFRRELGTTNGNSALRRESQGSLNSSASLDLGFLAFVSSKSETQSHRKSLGGTEGESENRVGRYCCVYLPDGTASLALIRPGLTIRSMLASICEKRGLSLPDIKVYLVGNEQKALVLDQDCTVLADQEVKLENRINFELEITALGKVVRITSKSSKRLKEALLPILGKHGLSLQQISVHLVRSRLPLTFHTHSHIPVLTLAQLSPRASHAILSGPPEQAGR
ncbi:regulator of G-protein signaling 14-like, partial [Vombatus ursinus]|uniref:regulator of G-protein signaling 14-like n=1 Tax=Vombatus ursinus TaxID=29139 RepID=UPI000FFD242C